MEKAKSPELDKGLDAVVTGYNGRKYTLYELRNSANNFKLDDPQEYREIIKEKYKKIYNCTEVKIPAEDLKEIYGLDESFVEEWETVPDWFFTKYSIAALQYEVSSLGRLRIGEKYLKQEAYKDGYLVISTDNPNCPEAKNHSVEIYKFIAAAFLGKLHHTDTYNIHHIDNNGYDCRPENLILLTPEEHSKVHGF